jgi:hypothetical protein
MHFIFSYILIISGNTVIEYETGCALIQATFAGIVVLSSIFGDVTRYKCSMCGISGSLHYHLFWVGEKTNAKVLHMYIAWKLQVSRY